jgi:hypothetical protein
LPPQGRRKDQKIHHDPHRGEHGKQKGKQAHPIDNHGCAPVGQQGKVLEGRCQPWQLRLFQLTGHQPGQALPYDFSQRFHQNSRSR